MLPYHALHPLYFISHISIGSLQSIEPGMDGLSPLLAHHAKTNPPLPDKRNHMVLQHVEFGCHTTLWETLTVVLKELVNVTNCRRSIVGPYAYT
jgi:hypothetical protein